MKRFSLASILLVAALSLGLGVVPQTATAQTASVMWINHLDFLAGDPSVVTSFNAVNSGVGGGLSGLIIESTTLGEEATGGGNKVVEKGVQVPPGYLISGVRVCYELSSPTSFISQIRLAQLQDPPGEAVVLLDDGTDLTAPGPVCVDSASVASINPGAGAVRLDLRVNFGDLADKIALRGVGLNLVVDPDSPMAQMETLLEILQNGLNTLQNHTHDYLTGKGVGHNNTLAVSGPPEPGSGTPVTPLGNNGQGRKPR